MENQKIGLTVYLLRPDKVAAFDGELKNAGTDVRPLAALDGEFVPLPSAVGEPPWVGVIRSALQKAPCHLTVRSGCLPSWPKSRK
jgi:hypothetical protein